MPALSTYCHDSAAPERASLVIMPGRAAFSTQPGAPVRERVVPVMVMPRAGSVRPRPASPARDTISFLTGMRFELSPKSRIHPEVTTPTCVGYCPDDDDDCWIRTRAEEEDEQQQGQSCCACKEKPWGRLYLKPATAHNARSAGDVGQQRGDEQRATTRRSPILTSVRTTPVEAIPASDRLRSQLSVPCVLRQSCLEEVEPQATGLPAGTAAARAISPSRATALRHPGVPHGRTDGEPRGKPDAASATTHHEAPDTTTTTKSSNSISKQDDHRSEMEKQDEYLRSSNRYRFHIIPDGNCLYRAVSKAVYGSQDMHAELREQTIHHIVDHLDEFGALIEGDVGEFIVAAAQNGAWAGYPELTAMSQMLGVGVRLTTGGSANCPTVSTMLHRFGKGNDEDGPTIWLSWLSNGHYDAVFDSPLPNDEYERWYERYVAQQRDDEEMAKAMALSLSRLFEEQNIRTR
uniref:OTU domain-containing protein 1 n=1 Tax=Petromyzon marinus TaxID=7757 RepID=A0AAJ7TQN0_PETMA|nr:OTU domain-containing protein 1 [Petromyzon marinus]